MEMNQVGLEEVFFHITQTILVHSQHFQLAKCFVFRGTDGYLNMGMVQALDFIDFE